MNCKENEAKRCPVCGSEDVKFSVSVSEKAKARHGVLYWIAIGWWLHPLMWLTLTLPMLIWRIIAPNRKTKTKVHTHAVCQSCGYTWRA